MNICSETEIAALTHRGLVREVNEDRHYVKCLDGQTLLMAVVDGMGGGPAGSAAAEAMREALTEYPVGAPHPEQALSKLVVTASEAILEIAHDNPALEGMGTTVTATVPALVERDPGSGEELQAADTWPVRHRRGEERVPELAAGVVEEQPDRPPPGDLALVVETPGELGVMAPLVGASHEEPDLVPMGATMTVPGVILVASSFAQLSSVPVMSGMIVVLVAAGILGGGVDPGGQGDALRTLEVRRRCGVGQHHRCQQQADNQRNRSPPCHRDTSSSSGSPSG